MDMLDRDALLQSLEMLRTGIKNRFPSTGDEKVDEAFGKLQSEMFTLQRTYTDLVRSYLEQDDDVKEKDEA